MSPFTYFLIPYKDKEVRGISKNKVNKYVTFKFTEWSNKHPHGVITNSLCK